MKIATHALAVLLAFGLYSQSANQKAQGNAGKQGDSFETRRLISKGGIGIVNTHLYIVVKSVSNDKNEIIVKPTEQTEQRWYGKNVTQTEVALFYAGKIWSSSQGLPDDFDLSKTAVVSFESRKVRFFDFQTMSGGYYERIPTD